MFLTRGRRARDKKEDADRSKAPTKVKKKNKKNHRESAETIDTVELTEDETEPVLETKKSDESVKTSKAINNKRNGTKRNTKVQRKSVKTPSKRPPLCQGLSWE